MERLRNGTHHTCTILESRNEDSIIPGGLAPGVSGHSKGRRAVYFSIVSPLEQNPDPKYTPHIHQKGHHDLVFGIDLESAMKSLDFQTAEGSVNVRDGSE